MRRLPLIIAFSLLAAGAAQAQSLEDRLRSQLVATTAQLHDLQNSQGSLAADKAAAEQQRDALKRKLAAVQAKGSSGGAEAQRYRAQADAALAAKAQSDIDLAAAQQEAARQASLVQSAQAERDRLVAELSQTKALLTAAQATNQQAAALSKEILHAYERVSFTDVMARNEPLTGLGRVKAENRAQTFADRIRDLELPPQPAPPPKP